MSGVTTTSARIGQVIDKRYLVRTEVGRGEFGVVFRVSDLDNQGEQYALKTLRSAQAGDATQIQRMGGQTSPMGGITFVSGLSEFPWDGEGVPTLLRKAWTAAAMARAKGPFNLDLYDEDEARAFLKEHTGIREEITVHLELLGSLELASFSESLPPIQPEER